MRLLSISPENQQRLAIVVPIVAMLLSLFVVYPTWLRYNALVGTIATQRSDLQALERAPLPDIGEVAPSEIGLPSEPPKFLGQIRLTAQLASCRVIGFDLGGATKADDGPVRGVRARVNLEGRYFEIRDFLYRLSRSPRLYVVTNCLLVLQSKSGQPNAVSRQSNLLNATIEIERYVTPPGT